MDGNNVLLGENGNHVIIGGEDRDLLIGGRGRDLLFDLGGENILIAGTTTFDNHDEALGSIMDEWSSVRDYQTRVMNFKGVDNPLFGNRGNGDFCLRKGETEFDDSAFDIMIGHGGPD